MNTPDSDAEAFAFQVADTDLGPFLVDALGRPVDEMSPLAPDLASYTAGSTRPSAELERALAAPRARDVAAVLACPSFKLWGRSGGGRTPFSSYAVCGRPATHPDLFIAASPSFENAWLFEVLEGVAGVAAWWTDTFAAPVPDTVPNLLPPPIELESLLYAFHAIDAFRRVTMRSLLDYRTTSEPAISVEEFVASMRESVRSHDLRWLLPAFMHLVPGLDLGGLDIRDEHLQVLVDQSLFATAAVEQDGTEVLVFGEAGIVLGTEFHDGWLSSAGFELVVRSGGVPTPQARGFLAPTPMTNHLVLVGADGTSVNHQVMTIEHLAVKLVALLTEAEGRAEEPPPVMRAPTAKVAPQPQVPALIGADASRQGERHELGARTTVGRATDNDLVVAEQTTSGHHAVLSFEAGQLRVEDLGSTNGTWIGGQRVEGTAVLADGDELRFGQTTYRVVLPAGATAEVIDDRTVALRTPPLPAVPPPPPSCPACGSKVSAGAKFCRRCGHAL